MARMSGNKDAAIHNGRFRDPDPVAKLNRRTLTDANVFALSISGGPGCGKTSLIDATIQKLLPNVKVGVIACDVAAQLDSHRAARDQVVQIDTGQQGTPDATHIRDGLQHLNLTRLDLLLIENVGPLAGTRPLDLGQDATAAVFSVAGGHNKADKHPHLVKSADLVLLTKTDLLGAFPFQLEIFRADVRRLNPDARLFELSSLNGDGLTPWLNWLVSRIKKHQPITPFSST